MHGVVTAVLGGGQGHELAPAFLPGRVAEVSCEGKSLGVMGEVHPEVITAFGLEHPIALASVDLNELLTFFDL